MNPGIVNESNQSKHPPHDLFVSGMQETTALCKKSGVISIPKTRNGDEASRIPHKIHSEPSRMRTRPRDLDQPASEPDQQNKKADEGDR